MDLEQQLQTQAVAAHAAIDRALDVAHSEIGRATHGAQRAEARMQRSMRRVVRRSGELGSEAGEYVRGHPCASAGVVFGLLAVLAGVLFAKRRW
jgi:ElaB/YqjD/DUF883 family membrane-anchored ribosome-binding protein